MDGAVFREDYRITSGKVFSLQECGDIWPKWKRVISGYGELKG